MRKDRRDFLARAGIAATGSGLLATQISSGQVSAGSNPLPEGDCSDLRDEVLALFSEIPERKALKIWAPATSKGAEFLVELNASRRMFVASTLKAVILCERLRQLDSPSIEERIIEHELALDENVWSPGRAVFDPPDLSGLVSERTTMEAMIVHSDNTATDMILKQAAPDAVREFIASIGLKEDDDPRQHTSLCRLSGRGLQLQDHYLAGVNLNPAGTSGPSIPQRCRDARILSGRPRFILLPRITGALL